MGWWYIYIYIFFFSFFFFFFFEMSILGYTVSESVYFAPLDWLAIGDTCFKELRLNCEPTVFAMQQLLWNIAHDNRSHVDVLKRILPIFQRAIDEELEVRKSLRNFGVNRWQQQSQRQTTDGAKKRRQTSASNSDDEDIECEVCRATLCFSRVECQARVWCLLHALEKIKERSRLAQQATVIFDHDDDELSQALRRVQDTIRMKSARRMAAHQRNATL